MKPLDARARHAASCQRSFGGNGMSQDGEPFSAALLHGGLLMCGCACHGQLVQCTGGCNQQTAGGLIKACLRNTAQDTLRVAVYVSGARGWVQLDVTTNMLEPGLQQVWGMDAITPVSPMLPPCSSHPVPPMFTLFLPCSHPVPPMFTPECRYVEPCAPVLAAPSASVQPPLRELSQRPCTRDAHCRGTHVSKNGAPTQLFQC